LLTATAWLPEQPLMSERIGRNTAIAMTCCSTSSFAAMTLAEMKFKTMFALSHERRLRERSNVGIVRSSSPPTMPWVKR
jgi:hypothetical protein